MQVRVAIIWFSLVVLPAFALFYEPRSGSLGSWLWEDEAQSTPDPGGEFPESSPARDASTFDGRRQVVQSLPTGANQGLESQQSVFNPAGIEPPWGRSAFPQEQIQPGRQQTEIGKGDGRYDPPQAHFRGGPARAEEASYPTEARLELEEMTSMLRAAGATYYVLECWEGPPKRYRFRCQFLSTDGQVTPVQLVAVSNDPRQAVAEVCLEMERRRSNSR